MRKFIIMGVQGCGKGTQAKMLAQDYDLVHISVGDVFRWHIQGHTKLAARIRRLITGGEMVPDEIVEEVVKARLDQHDWNYGFILDGFPQRPSGGVLPRKLRYQRRYSDRRAGPRRSRASSIGVCSKCGLDYNLIFHHPAVAGVCDVCKGALVARADDTPEAVGERLRDYHTKTQPILDLFRRKELIVTADGTKPAADVQKEIREQLGLGIGHRE